MISALLLLLAAASCPAQSPATPAGGAATEAERLARLDPSIRLRVAALLDSARADSLPAEPLIQRALEGTAKGASPARIASAVEAMLVRLQESRHLLGPAREADELVAAAGCLGAGIDSTTLRRLGATAREAPLVVPLIVLTDLVGRGVPVATAGRVTLEMVAAGYSDRHFLDLRLAVQQDLLAGAPPDQTLLARFRALSSVGSSPGYAPGGTQRPPDRSKDVSPEGR